MQQNTSADAFSRSHTHEGQGSRRTGSAAGSVAGSAAGTAPSPPLPKGADAGIVGGPRDAPPSPRGQGEMRVQGERQAGACQDETGSGSKRKLWSSSPSDHDAARASKRERQQRPEARMAERDKAGAELLDTRAIAGGWHANQGGGLAGQSTAPTGALSRSLRTRCEVGLQPYRQPASRFSRWRLCVLCQPEIRAALCRRLCWQHSCGVLVPL